MSTVGKPISSLKPAKKESKEKSKDKSKSSSSKEAAGSSSDKPTEGEASKSEAKESSKAESKEEGEKKEEKKEKKDKKKRSKVKKSDSKGNADLWYALFTAFTAHISPCHQPVHILAPCSDPKALVLAHDTDCVSCPMRCVRRSALEKEIADVSDDELDSITPDLNAPSEGNVLSQSGGQATVRPHNTHIPVQLSLESTALRNKPVNAPSYLLSI